MRGIPFADIEVGKQYQYEEKYYLACVATVLDKEESPPNGVNGNDSHPYIRFRLRVDEVIFGNAKKGEVFEVGGTTDPRLQHYVSSKFKPVGSPTDYVRL